MFVRTLYRVSSQIDVLKNVQSMPLLCSAMACRRLWKTASRMSSCTRSILWISTNTLRRKKWHVDTKSARRVTADVERLYYRTHYDACLKKALSYSRCSCGALFHLVK